MPEGKDPLSFIRYVNENVLNFISHPKKSELIITILSNFDYAINERIIIVVSDNFDKCLESIKGINLLCTILKNKNYEQYELTQKLFEKV